MRPGIQAGIGIGLLLTPCVAVQAQQRPHRGPAVVLSAPAGTRVIQTAQPATAAHSPAAVGSQAVLSGSIDLSSAPGFGFDFTHAAALNRNLAIRALIDPVTQHRLALERQLLRDRPVVPFAGPVIFNPIQINIVQQPPVVVLQQPAESEPSALRPTRVRYSEREAEAETLREQVVSPGATERPLRDLPEFVLVRRDGMLLFAVAFFVERNRLVYITPEGHRRILPLSDLDPEATLQINESRGTPLHLPF